MLLQKYRIPLAFSCDFIAMFLFMPYIFSVVFAAFAIGVHEKMTLTNYFILLGELFVIRWTYHIPAIGLIIIGIMLKRKS